MSRTQPAYVTEETYQSHRSRQDTDIRREFGRQAALIEKGNKQLQVDLTTTFNNKLSNVNGTLSGRVGELSHEVQKRKSEVSQMEGRSFNRSRILPRHTLSSIGIFRSDIGFTLPEYFPPTINDFWKLQFPPQEEKLIYLLRFYQIQGYDQWGQIVDGFDTNPASDI
ncbi:hypothetical protein IFR04_013577 [Cadophora malorum]|uniref:Uncharacterized protein n=1 Tax=Cadophora malorum TaxID=108018 RepID=A0A8H7T6R3_9HELO|nr:hypothetical protein IFR04_013577 [Cadophora malorum]